MDFESFRDVRKEVKLPILKLAELGFNYDVNTKKITCSGGCSFSTSNLKVDRFYDLINHHLNEQVTECKLNSIHLNFLNPITQDKECKTRKPEIFKDENERIKSFIGFESAVDLTKLAKNGFYTLLEDVNISKNNIMSIYCYFCSYSCVLFKNRNLNENYEIPEEDHLKKYPDCKMNKDRRFEIESLGNNVIFNINNQADGKEIQPIHYNASTNELQNYEMIKYILDKTINSTNEKPNHTGYTQEHQRLESFTNWPSHVLQKPLDLAKAGFYYYGVNDMVKCFFCSGVIRSWDVLDDPIIEHTRWYPRCPFIKLSKGKEFIERVQEMYKDRDSGFTHEYEESNKDRKFLNGEIKARKRSISPRKINSRMDLPIIQRIINLRVFERSLIKHVIESKLIEDDDDFENPVELLKACYNLKEKSRIVEDKLIEAFHFYVSNVNLAISYDKVCEIFKKKFNISIRMIKKYHIQENEKFGTLFVRLISKDESRCDEIVNELNDQVIPEMEKTNKLTVKKIFKRKLNQENNDESKKENIRIKEFKKKIKEDKSLQNEVDLLKEERRCVICLEKDKIIIFLPCSHLASCLDCSVSLKNCPMCRKSIEASIRTFI